MPQLDLDAFRRGMAGAPDLSESAARFYQLKNLMTQNQYNEQKLADLPAERAHTQRMREMDIDDATLNRAIKENELVGLAAQRILQSDDANLQGAWDSEVADLQRMRLDVSRIPKVADRNYARQAWQRTQAYSQQLAQLAQQRGKAPTTMETDQGIIQWNPEKGGWDVTGFNKPKPAPDTPFKAWMQQNPTAPVSDFINLEEKPKLDLQRRAQDIQIRGQNMTDARQRDLNQITRDAKAQDKQEKKDQLAQNAGASYDLALATLDRLEKHPGLEASVGSGLGKTVSALSLGILPETLPGTDHAGFLAHLETFKSQVFLPMVANLRGMGALSDAEGKKLSAAVGALDRSMSEKEFKASIKQIRADLERAKARAAGQQSSGGEKPNDPLGILD